MGSCISAPSPARGKRHKRVLSPVEIVIQEVQHAVQRVITASAQIIVDGKRERVDAAQAAADDAFYADLGDFKCKGREQEVIARLSYALQHTTKFTTESPSFHEAFCHVLEEGRLKVPLRTLFRWNKMFADSKQAFEPKGDEETRGRPALMTAAQERFTLGWVLHQNMTGVQVFFTSIVEIIKSVFGVEVSLQLVRNLCHLQGLARHVAEVKQNRIASSVLNQTEQIVSTMLDLQPYWHQYPLSHCVFTDCTSNRHGHIKQHTVSGCGAGTALHVFRDELI